MDIAKKACWQYTCSQCSQNCRLNCGPYLGHSTLKGVAAMTTLCLWWKRWYSRKSMVVFCRNSFYRENKFSDVLWKHVSRCRNFYQCLCRIRPAVSSILDGFWNVWGLKQNVWCEHWSFVPSGSHNVLCKLYCFYVKLASNNQSFYVLLSIDIEHMSTRWKTYTKNIAIFLLEI